MYACELSFENEGPSQLVISSEGILARRLDMAPAMFISST